VIKKDMSERASVRVSKSLQPTAKAKKSKGISRHKPFPPIKPPQPTAANTAQSSTPKSAVFSQSFTRNDISDMTNDYLQKQSELPLMKP